MIMGVIVAILVLLLVVFVPGINQIMFTASFPGPVWAISLLYLLYICLLTEWIKAQSRINPSGWVSRHLCW